MSGSKRQKKVGHEVPMLNLAAIRSTQSQSLSTHSDLELVERARNGDFSAFEELFERYRTLAFRFAFRLTPRRDDAEDIVQEAFVRAYQNLNRYRDEAKFTTWLLRIISNLSTDYARTSNRRSALEQQEAAFGLDWMTAPPLEDPVENIHEARRKAALHQAVASLPHHHRTMIILRDLEDRDYAEIAQLVGCSIGGAKLRVLRARRALKDRLAPLFADQIEGGRIER